MPAGEVRVRAMVWARGRPVQVQWPARHVVARNRDVSWEIGCFPTRLGECRAARSIWVVVLSRQQRGEGPPIKSDGRKGGFVGQSGRSALGGRSDETAARSPEQKSDSHRSVAR